MGEILNRSRRWLFYERLLEPVNVRIVDWVSISGPDSTEKLAELTVALVCKPLCSEYAAVSSRGALGCILTVDGSLARLVQGCVGNERVLAIPASRKVRLRCAKLRRPDHVPEQVVLQEGRFFFLLARQVDHDDVRIGYPLLRYCLSV